METNLLVIVGPTASGKTSMAVALARKLGAEIVSADSRQVYRELDIGAGKDREEYSTGGPAVACHLIDIVGLDTEYSVFDYQQDFYRVFDRLQQRGVLPIMVGGSGLYIESVLLRYPLVPVEPDPQLREELEKLDDEQLEKRLRELKPRLHATTDTSSRQRMIRAIEIELHSRKSHPPPAPCINPLVLGVRHSPELLRERIRKRLRARIEAGMIEEVRRLLGSGVPPERLLALGLEYRYITEYLRGNIQGEKELFRVLAKAIIDFARRQRTWFRRMERRGIRIHWLDGADPEAALRIVHERMPNRCQPPNAG
ncbi:MAG: tRNA (adenosine(37)-N6)-dimethylallyltransferase MiaA [Deltaproteobacteria bacterium]|nr:MAG: tRNA (adenosine(37)-N6)-dimethylallyltransferase MiaA [Deltaproteobacteria bacterium]